MVENGDQVPNDILSHILCMACKLRRINVRNQKVIISIIQLLKKLWTLKI